MVMQLPIPLKYIDTPYYPTLEADALADHIQIYLNAGWYSITSQIASQVTYTWH